MKLRRNKKGFTIIELVIVIAVIGILAAVLIPTFVNLTNKANEAADNALVNNLNKALKMEEQEPGHQKAPTLEGAIQDLEDQGYLLENLASKSGKDLLWSQSENQFLLNTEGKSGKDYWKIVDAMPAEKNQKYSYYAGKNFKDTNVTAKYGFDAGRNDGIAKVTYKGTGTAQEVAIRTKGGTLAITDTNIDSEQHHYGAANVISVATGTSCYYEHGVVTTLAVKEGKAVIASEGVVVNAGKIGTAQIEIKEHGTVYNQFADKTEEQLKAIKYGGGTGTALDPYLIYTPLNMMDVAAEINSTLPSASIKLMVNIDLTGYDWVPFGDENTASRLFTGTVFGNEKSILNLTGTKVGGSEATGLIAFVGNGARVEKLNLDVHLSGRNEIGGVIGSFEGVSCATLDDNPEITISDVHVTGDIKSTKRAGGLVSVVQPKEGTSAKGTLTLNIDNCSFEGKISTTGYRAAGLIGSIGNGATVIARESSFDGNVEANFSSNSRYTCGIVGFFGNGANVQLYVENVTISEDSTFTSVSGHKSGGIPSGKVIKDANGKALLWAQDGANKMTEDPIPSAKYKVIQGVVSTWVEEQAN